MECLSRRFVKAVETLLDPGTLVLATIAARGGGLIEHARRRPDAELWTAPIQR
jgi:nucleoside-triphosphatase THEP1